MIVDKYGRVAGSIDLAALSEMYAACDDDDLKAHYREVAAESGVDLGTAPAAKAEAKAEVEPEASGPPPRSGPGSGRDAWADYAESLGLDVSDDMNRDEIMTLVDEGE